MLPASAVLRLVARASTLASSGLSRPTIFSRYNGGNCSAMPALALLSLLLQASQVAAPKWDTFPDTWVGVDALGRTLPGPKSVGPPRQGKTLGTFGEPNLDTNITLSPDGTQGAARDAGERDFLPGGGRFLGSNPADRIPELGV